MPSDDANGSFPDASPVALLLIDVINPFDFPRGDELAAAAREAAEQILGLERRAREAGVPVLYVNDNFGRWRSDFRQVVERVTDGSRGEEIARRLHPEDDDYFVLKPMSSGFFRTSLETLLDRIGAHTLVLTGFAGDVCVQATAFDAHMRGYRTVVPRDAIASVEPEDDRRALAYMERVCDSRTPPAAEVDFERLARSSSDDGSA